MDELIELISVSYEYDSLKQRVPTETTASVWAHIGSVSRAEWYQGGQAGLRPSLMVTTPIVNYDGQETVIVKGKRYTVYRTYFNYDRDEVELYLEERVSDIDTNSIG